MCKFFCIKIFLLPIVAQKGASILIYLFFFNMVLNMVLNVVPNLVLNSISRCGVCGWGGGGCGATGIIIGVQVARAEDRLNWLSFETVTLIMRMCLKMMFLFPKVMWFLQRDLFERDYPKHCIISLSNYINMICVAFSETVWSLGCKNIVCIIAHLKIAEKKHT